MASGGTTQGVINVTAAPGLQSAGLAGAAVSRDGIVRRAYRAALLLCLAGVAVLAVDIPMSRAGRSLLDAPLLGPVWALCELFGDGLGVLLILSVLFLAYKAARPQLPRILACALGGGLAADAIKLVVVRCRPRAFDYAEGVLGSFQGLGPWAGEGEGLVIWDSGLHSFPSAHAATAAGLAMGLVWIFPRARPAVVGLTGLVMCQRIVTGAHFLSDTLVGAAVGCIVAAYCLDHRGLGLRLDALEARLRRGNGGLDCP